MKRSPLFWFGVAFLLLLAVYAVVGPEFRHSWLYSSGRAREYPSAMHWFGTDEKGIDIFARMAYGARVSLLIGFTVQILAVTVGVLVGVLGVFAPKWIADPLMRLTDGMFAFPDLLLAIMLVGLFGMGTGPVVVALAISAWPSVARLVRTQVASLKDREFVVASRAMGAPVSVTVVRHVLPHLMGVILAVAMVDVAAVILSESTLSFLGIGVQLPQTSGGSMIRAGSDYKESHPIMLVWPCVALALTVFALNFVGDGLRSMTDPTGSQVR